MKRYHYERESGGYSVRDRLRGYGDGYSLETERAMARCDDVADAERIVSLLNAADEKANENG